MATSIKVSLELDDRGYLTGIKAATDETNKLKDAAEKGTTAIGTGFSNAQGKLDTFSNKMATLTGLLLGAGFVEFGKRSLAAADNVVDLSNATDVSVSKILQLRDAFAANGGSAEGLNKVISKLSQSLYDAREGGAVAQENLIKLGFSMKDIANLDTDQALAKTVDKLAAMTDPIERNALAFRIFGREAKTIDWKGIQDGTKNASDEYDKMAESQRKAAQAHDKLNLAMDKLTIAFANMLEKKGVLDFINNLDSSMEKFERTVNIATAAFELFIGAKFLSMIATALTKLGLLEATVARIAILAKNPILIAVMLATFSSDLNKGEDEQLKKIQKFQEALGKLTKDQQEKFFKLNQDQQTGIKKLFEGGTDIETAFAKITGIKATKPDTQVYWNKETAAILEQVKAFDLLITRQQQDNAQTTALIGAGEEQIAFLKDQTDWTKKYREELDKLNKQEATLKAENSSARTAGLINDIIRAKEKLKDIYYKGQDAVDADTEAKNRAVGQDKLNNMVFKDQIALRERLNSLTLETSKIGLSTLEKKYKDVEAAALKAADAELIAEAKRRFGVNDAGEINFKGKKLPKIENPTDLTNELEKAKTAVATLETVIVTGTANTSAEWERFKLAYLKGVKERIDAEKGATKSAYEQQNSFTSGWKEAFARYQDDATNAAKQAQSAFNLFSKGFEDVLVNLVTGSKTSFKEIANTLIAEFVRIQAKKLFANLFSGEGTSSIFAAIMGKASGGPVNGMTPYLVGEQGPELFVPRGAGTIIPNGQMGGGAAVTYNINAVDAASFRQMLAREPEFLYAVTEKGRSSVPAGRR
jgi:hypothetical protein